MIIINLGIYADALQTEKIFGVGSFLKNLLKHLDLGRVTLLLMKGMNYHWENNVNKKFYGIPISKPKLLKIINRILTHNQVANESFDLIYWPHQQIYFLRKPKSKFIFTLHDLIPLIFPRWHSKFNVYFDFKVMLKRAARYAERIVCVSKTTKKDFLRFFNKKHEEKIVIIHNGIDQNVFHARKKSEIKMIKEKFGITKNYILYTGGFHPRKNVETLLKAFDIVRKKENIQLVLTGEGLGVFKNFDKTYYSLKYRKDVKVLGFVKEENLPALYSGAILYVNPSFYEGFGLGPLEALACGVPVIASDIPVVNEVVPFVEKFQPHSEHQLATKIKELLNNKNKKKEIIKNSKKIVKKLSWKDAAKKYKELFEESVK